ncbi:hypothetical protein BDR22DRAFT_392841 [Usnea florida]
MPVKWTAETDQILLLKILETSEVSPKYKDIAEKWPTGVERPTPRAISERIAKIREKAKASGTASHFSVPSAASNNPSTPRKKSTTSTAKKPAPSKTNGAKARPSKRKRAEPMSDDDDSDATTFQSSNNASDASDEETPQQKKPKLNAKTKAKSNELTKVKAEEEENGMYDSEGTVGGSAAVDHVDDYA